jgi:hypothetical protein
MSQETCPGTRHGKPPREQGLVPVVVLPFFTVGYSQCKQTPVSDRPGLFVLAIKWQQMV